MHTSVTLIRHTALSATDAYELSVHVAGLAPHRRGTEAAVVTVLRTAGGDVVWESTSTYLARHRTDGPAPGPARREHGPLPAVAEWCLGPDVGRRYAAVSGDRNPIHLHPLTARLFGFPRAIAHGMWTVARCLAAHGAPDAALVRARFGSPVLLPGTVVHAADALGHFELRDTSGTGVPPLERRREWGRVHLTGQVLPPPA